MRISKKAAGECAFLLVLLLFFLYIVLDSISFPNDARLFPMVLGIPSTIICICLLVKRVITSKAEVEAEKASEDNSSKVSSASTVAAKRPLGKWFPFAFALLYFILVYLIGYLLATAIVLLVVPFLLGYRKKRLIILTAVGVMLLIIAVFGWLLSLDFYSGLLGLL